MNSKELKDIIEANTEYFDEGEYGTECNIYYDLILEQVGQKIQDEVFERVNQGLWEALQSDLEHGVKCLNENAAKEFYSKYPQLKSFIEWLDMQHIYEVQ